MSSKKRPKSVGGTAAPGLSTCTVTPRVCATAGAACKAVSASAQASLRSLDEKLLPVRYFLISLLRVKRISPQRHRGTAWGQYLFKLCLCVSVVNPFILTRAAITLMACGRRFGRAGHAPDELHLFGHVRRPVVAEDLVEPDGRLAVGVGAPPGVPGQVGLRPALHEAPVDHPDVVRLADRQPAEEEAAVAARHVLGADHRAVVALEPVDALLKLRRGVVVVEGDDVGELYLQAIRRRHLLRCRPVALPRPARQGLYGPGRARPRERLRQERQHEVDLVLRLLLVVAPAVL